MNKTKKTRAPRKGKRSADITTTSVAFKTPILEGLKKHELVTEKERSVSYIVNRLSEKFLTGEIPLE